MTVLISSNDEEKSFKNKEFITIGSNANCDFVLDLGFEFAMTLQCNNKNCVLINNFSDDKITFKGKPIGKKIEFDEICKLLILNSDEFICIKIIQDISANAENIKSDLEKNRIAATKQVSFAINEIKKRTNLNFKTAIFLNIALFLSALVIAFGVTNYLMGLPVTMTSNYLNMPTNLKMLGLFAFIIFGICLIFKQGIYIFLRNKSKSTVTSKLAEKFMLGISMIFIIAFYVINLIYYMAPDGKLVFSILISLFFVGLMSTLAIGAGYFKFTGHELSIELDKYEYKEDFENILNHYQQWIETHINSLSKVKIGYIKDKLFMLQLKGLCETILGILTAPFLAYGVSNTLAMCFPEAAGWIRISGLRFSPVFLILSTMLIVFAFFAFVNGFLCTKKIQGSNVIKLDGFRNYLFHGVDIFGLENIRKLDLEKNRSFIIGCTIIFIEFTMNTSFFMTEIGGSLGGLLLSLIAALVPTALLIAETYMLSQTKFEIYASDGLISKLDQ